MNWVFQTVRIRYSQKQWGPGLSSSYTVISVSQQDRRRTERTSTNNEGPTFYRWHKGPKVKVCSTIFRSSFFFPRFPVFSYMYDLDRGKKFKSFWKYKSLKGGSFARKYWEPVLLRSVGGSWPFTDQWNCSKWTIDFNKVSQKKERVYVSRILLHVYESVIL